MMKQPLARIALAITIFAAPAAIGQHVMHNGAQSGDEKTPAVAGQEPLPRQARRPRAQRDDARREDRSPAWQQHARLAWPQVSHCLYGQRRRGLRPRCPASRHSHHPDERRCLRRPQQWRKRPLLHRSPVEPRLRLELGPGGRLRLRRAHRPRAPQPGLQHDPRRRRQRHPRPPQRPHIRVHGRRPHPRRNARRQPHQVRAGPARYRRHQALRRQRPGERPQRGRLHHLEARHARERSAGLRNRH